MKLLDHAAAGLAVRRDRGNCQLRRREAHRRAGVDLARLPQAVHASVGPQMVPRSRSSRLRGATIALRDWRVAE
jgi:hypothetical protein